jgi:hypothetical protein
MSDIYRYIYIHLGTSSIEDATKTLETVRNEARKSPRNSPHKTEAPTQVKKVKVKTPKKSFAMRKRKSPASTSKTSTGGISKRSKEILANAVAKSSLEK